MNHRDGEMAQVAMTFFTILWLLQALLAMAENDDPQDTVVSNQ